MTASLKRALYLLLALPVGIVSFAVVVAGVTTGVGSAVTVIGLPVLGLTAAAARLMAQGERRLIDVLLGERLVAVYRRPVGEGVWERLRAPLSDPQTYKDLVYQVLALPLGILWFTLAVLLLVAAVLLVPTLAFSRAPMRLLLRGFDALAAAHLAWARLVLAAEPDPELTARVEVLRVSRARLVEAGDEARRRLERDLHDGAQQRLVAMSLKLGMARAQLEREGGEAAALIAEAHEESKLALAELRDLARGIHPAVLTDRGLAAALQDLCDRSPVPAEVLGAPVDRLPQAVEGTAYFVVAEALANVAKYASAGRVTVQARLEVGRLVVEVRDDGVGGAAAGPGSGLSGLTDRVGALEGRLVVVSPAGEGTLVRAEIPVAEVAEPA